MDNIDTEQALKELTMALIYLSRMSYGKNPVNGSECFFAWKGYDFDVLDELARAGYIDLGKIPSKRKTLDLMQEGAEYGKSLLKKYGINDPTEI